MHAYDKCEMMNEDGKGDDEECCGMPTWSRITYVEGQGGDLSNDETCSEDMAELWQCMVDHGKEGVAEEYSRGNLWGSSSFEQEEEVINGT